MVDILISHANQDNRRIQVLVDLLASKHWSIWWNKEIAPGEAEDMATEVELEQASVVITVWSKHSVQSRLIRNTAFEAIETHRWLPLLFDVVRPPLRYRNYRSIEMVGWPEQGKAEAEQSLLLCCEELLADTGLHDSPTKIIAAQETSASKLHDTSMSTEVNEPTLRTKFATIQLNEWVVEEGQNRIIRNGRTKKITPRSMQVLMYLVENRQMPTSIERILSHVWRDRVVVESVVHRCISELRDAFEDDFRHPQYIETIAKRGYRIVASVSEPDIVTNH